MKTPLFFVLYGRQILFAASFCFVVHVPCRAAAEYPPALLLPPLPSEGLQLHFKESAFPDAAPALHFGQTSSQKGPYKPGIITGSIMFFGGGMLYAVGHVLAARTYEDYHHSAFTVQTDRLHGRILIYNVMRFGGGALGGIGLIAVLVSF